MRHQRQPQATRPASPRRGYGGPSQHPLSHRQKGIICKVARRAFELHKPDGMPFEEWRHREQQAAVGVGSLVAATQNDYLPLVAHFEGLAGEGGRQFEATYRQQDEAQRQARHLLDAALRARGLDPAYAEKICRVQYRRGLDRASAEQLCQLKFTVEARRSLAPATADVEMEQPF